jgi:hypothetical protein
MIGSSTQSTPVSKYPPAPKITEEELKAMGNLKDRRKIFESLIAKQNPTEHLENKQEAPKLNVTVVTIECVTVLNVIQVSEKIESAQQLLEPIQVETKAKKKKIKHADKHEVINHNIKAAQSSIHNLLQSINSFLDEQVEIYGAYKRRGGYYPAIDEVNGTKQLKWNSFEKPVSSSEEMQILSKEEQKETVKALDYMLTAFQLALDNGITHIINSDPFSKEEIIPLPLDKLVDKAWCKRLLIDRTFCKLKSKEQKRIRHRVIDILQLISTKDSVDTAKKIDQFVNSGILQKIVDQLIELQMKSVEQEKQKILDLGTPPPKPVAPKAASPRAQPFSPRYKSVGEVARSPTIRKKMRSRKNKFTPFYAANEGLRKLDKVELKALALKWGCKMAFEVDGVGAIKRVLFKPESLIGVMNDKDTSSEIKRTLEEYSSNLSAYLAFNESWAHSKKNLRKFIIEHITDQKQRKLIEEYKAGNFSNCLIVFKQGDMNLVLQSVIKNIYEIASERLFTNKEKKDKYKAEFQRVMNGYPVLDWSKVTKFFTKITYKLTKLAYKPSDQ